jgi:hypothetical protein
MSSPSLSSLPACASEGKAARAAAFPNAGPFSLSDVLPIAVMVMTVDAMIVVVAVVAIIIIVAVIAIIVMVAVVIISMAPMMSAVDAGNAHGC